MKQSGKWAKCDEATPNGVEIMRQGKVESRGAMFGQSLVNAGIILLGYYVSFFIRFVQNIKAQNIEPFFDLVPYIGLISLVFSYLYLADHNDRTYGEAMYSVVLAVAMIQIITMALSFFARGFSFPRSIFAISFGVQVFMLAIWEFMIFGFFNRYGKKRRILFVGAGENVRKAAWNLMHFQYGGFEVVGEVLPVDFDEKAYKDGVDSVYIASDIQL